MGAQGRPRTEPTTLTPAAERTLPDAYRIFRTEGSTCIGPEHLLRALAADARSAAGRALAESGLESGRLPAGDATTGRRRPSSTPTVDETAGASPKTPVPGASTR
ncbi:Clp protease N-terminal domain-containing protein [Streptomyces olivaceoviridis]|uniref:Clp protease N-terminal domain-containing protein n=1 Tax=Streptomyces olivaceoviridis TaxID=1921 RepID=UPI0036FF0416